MKLNKTLLNKLSRRSLIVTSETRTMIKRDHSRIILDNAAINAAQPFFTHVCQDKGLVVGEGTIEDITDRTSTGLTLGDLQLDKVAPVAYADETRPVLTCINISADAITATDSYRLITVSGDYEKLPQGLYKATDLSLALAIYGPDMAIDRGPDGFYGASLIVGDMQIEQAADYDTYPNWKALFPDSWTYEVTSTVLPVTKEIKHPLGSKKPVMVDITGNAVYTVASIDGGKSFVNLDSTVHISHDNFDDDATVSINQVFYAHLTKVFNGAPVSIEWIAQNKPILFSQEQTRYLVMPIRHDRKYAPYCIEKIEGEVSE